MLKVQIEELKKGGGGGGQRHFSRVDITGQSQTFNQRGQFRSSLSKNRTNAPKHDFNLSVSMTQTLVADLVFV